MHIFLGPQIINYDWNWDGINSFLSVKFHGLILSLDTRYKLEGHTVLYIPAEAMNMKPEVVFKDKELVQRLESEWLALPVCWGS